MAFASCSNGNDNIDTVYEQSFLNCYAVVTDITDPAQMTVSSPVTIKWTTNWTQLKAEGTISGLTIGGATYPTITLSDLPWTMNQWCVASSSAPTTSIASGTPSAVTNFSLSWLDRLDFGYAVGNYDPGLVFSFVLDGKYKIEGSRSPIVLAGTIESVPAEGPMFTSTKPLYSFVFDFSKRLAEIRLANIQFSDIMPQMSLMTFPGIPFTISPDGKKLFLQTESLIPCIGDTPYPNFPITQLSATVTPGQGADLDFVCTFRDMPYNISVKADYTSYTDAISN